MSPLATFIDPGAVPVVEILSGAYVDPLAAATPGPIPVLTPRTPYPMFAGNVPDVTDVPSTPAFAVPSVVVEPLTPGPPEEEPLTPAPDPDPSPTTPDPPEVAASPYTPDFEADVL